MNWYVAVLYTLGILAAWAFTPLVADLFDKAFQRRMAATLWRSLPYNPSPWQRARDRRKAAAANLRMAELEAALTTASAETREEAAHDDAA